MLRDLFRRPDHAALTDLLACNRLKMRDLLAEVAEAQGRPTSDYMVALDATGSPPEIRVLFDADGVRLCRELGLKPPPMSETGFRWVAAHSSGAVECGVAETVGVEVGHG